MKRISGLLSVLFFTVSLNLFLGDGCHTFFPDSKPMSDITEMAGTSDQFETYCSHAHEAQVVMEGFNSLHLFKKTPEGFLPTVSDIYPIGYLFAIWQPPKYS